jgi:hypothetical protein
MVMAIYSSAAEHPQFGATFTAVASSGGLDKPGSLHSLLCTRVRVLFYFILLV